MSLFTRDEIERQWAHYQKVARRCGPAGDWTELCDLYTEDATMIVSGGVKVGGREAMKRWYREALGVEPMRSLHYYPVEWFEPYLGRRRKIGWDLYGILDIGKKDYDKMHAQHGRNYTFFDAPVGMIFTIDRRLLQGSWLDYGMFIENIMVAARGRGLDTCPQQAFAHYHAIIEEELDLPETDMVMCGMALGVEDKNVVANALVTERAPVADFTTFLDR